MSRAFHAASACLSKSISRNQARIWFQLGMVRDITIVLPCRSEDPAERQLGLETVRPGVLGEVDRCEADLPVEDACQCLTCHDLVGREHVTQPAEAILEHATHAPEVERADGS